MITKFNEYQKLLEDEMIQPMSAGSGGSWIEKESLNKGALSKFFGSKSKEKVETTPKADVKPETKKTTEIDSTINQYSELLTNTPILNMSAKTYASLNGMIEQDSDEFNLELNGGLDENSSMLDIAYKYYIKNITDIIIDIQDAPSDYMSEEIREENFVKLTNNPVTIGTLVGNAITEWFSSKDPMSSLNKSLDSSYIVPKEGVLESFQMYDDFLNESGSGRGKVGLLTDLLNISKRVGKSGSSVFGKSKYGSAYSGYTPISKKAGLNLSSTIGSSPVVSSNSSVTKAIEKTAPKSFSALKKIADAAKGGGPKAGFLKNSIDALKRKTSKLDGKVLSARGLFKSKVIGKTIGLISLFYLPGFIVNKVLTEWTGIFESPQSAEDMAIDFMMKFEEDMVSRGHSPFTIYDKIYDDYKFNLDRFNNFKDIVIGWCESLYEVKIIDNQTLDICKRQINSDVFDMYLKESSYMTDKLTSYLENKWIDNISSPTPTLTILSTVVMFFTLLERFEDQLYAGKVPIALPKEITEIKRFDKEGNERDYLTVGDSGDDVAILQDMLKTFGVYKGEVDGVYDSEIASLIEDIQNDAKSTDENIIINGNTDRRTLKFIEKFLILKSNKVQGNIGGRKTSSQQELETQAANLIVR